jgi:hypothetical protein
VQRPATPPGSRTGRDAWPSYASVAAIGYAIYGVGAIAPGLQADLLAILDARTLNLADIGTTEDRLADMDTRQDPSASIDFEGKKWSWDSSREIRYYENESGQGEGLYRWLFREPEGNRLVCVEKWEGEPFEVRIARRLNQRDLTVYRAASGAAA